MNVPRAESPRTNKKKEKEPIVFGEEDLIKLLEDTDSTSIGINKTLKWFRKKFVRKHFAPHLRRILQNHLAKLEEHHTVEVKKFKDKHGNELLSTLAKVKDLKHFVSMIAGIRDIIKPKLTLGLDGNTNQCVVSGIIHEADNNKVGGFDEGSEYNPGGKKTCFNACKS